MITLMIIYLKGNNTGGECKRSARAMISFETVLSINSPYKVGIILNMEKYMLFIYLLTYTKDVLSF